MVFDFTLAMHQPPIHITTRLNYLDVPHRYPIKGPCWATYHTPNTAFLFLPFGNIAALPRLITLL